MRKLIAVASLIISAFLHGCATVPMASVESDKERKEFSAPSQGTAGLYIYRNSALGGALKKSVYVDGQLVGETAPMTYFYKEVQPGERLLSTESEFSNNDLTLDAKIGQNYFVRQYIKIGVFVGGANLEIVSDEEGKKGVLQCKLANTFDYDSLTYSSKTDKSVIEQTLETEQLPLKQTGVYDLSGTYSSTITGFNAQNILGINPEVKLTQKGNKVSGTYGTAGGHFWGEIEDGRIKFEYRESGGGSGSGEWTVEPDSGEIIGKWSSRTWQGSGKWNLTRTE